MASGTPASSCPVVAPWVVLRSDQDHRRPGPRPFQGLRHVWRSRVVFEQGRWAVGLQVPVAPVPIVVKGQPNGALATGTLPQCLQLRTGTSTAWSAHGNLH